METIETANRILLDDVVVDMKTYPRTAPVESTIYRYAEAMKAGDEFPPIILEQGTNVLLDGLHRWKAAPLADRDWLPVEYHVVPEGMPLKLYAASLSARHGVTIANVDLKQVARDTIRENPHYSQKNIAQKLGVTPRTVSTWVSDITEHHRDVLKIRALVLLRLGKTKTEIAEHLDSKRETVRDWLAAENGNGNFPPLTEELIAEAIEIWPDDNGEIAEIVEQLRDEMIFGHWSDVERMLLEDLRGGETIVVSMPRKHEDGPHDNLVPWLRDTGQLVRIDRGSKWGNPFEMPDDGDRPTVVEKYERYYLPHKPMLLDKLPELRGKALGCWCAPKACHGDILKAAAEGEGIVAGDGLTR